MLNFVFKHSMYRIGTMALVTCYLSLRILESQIKQKFCSNVCAAFIEFEQTTFSCLNVESTRTRYCLPLIGLAQAACRRICDF